MSPLLVYLYHWSVCICSTCIWFMRHWRPNYRQQCSASAILPASWSYPEKRTEMYVSRLLQVLLRTLWIMIMMMMMMICSVPLPSLPHLLPLTYWHEGEVMTDVDTYRDCLRTLRTQAVVEAKTNFVPNRVLGASPPDISPLESLLPRSVRTTLAQLRSGHCRLLNSYKARITSGISNVCPECGVAPHSIEHLFIRRNLQCKTCGTTRLRSQTSPTYTTDDRGRAAGLSQWQQHIDIVVCINCICPTV